MRRPIILNGLEQILEEEKAGNDVQYDPVTQIWRRVSDGIPVVLISTNLSDEGPVSSRFGETVSTATREGTDQPEGNRGKGLIKSSRFGETTFTRTREGHDQAEGQLASRFGETVKTATREGSDQTEVSSGDSFI